MKNGITPASCLDFVSVVFCPLRKKNAIMMTNRMPTIPGTAFPVARYTTAARNMMAVPMTVTINPVLGRLPEAAAGD